MDLIRSNKYLNRSNDDIVDGDEDQLDEEPDETHHDEPDRCPERDLGEFYTTINHQISSITHAYQRI